MERGYGAIDNGVQMETLNVEKVWRQGEWKWIQGGKVWKME